MLGEIPFFRREGLQRRECASCGARYWSRDPGRRTCGDAPCEPYGFIGAPPLRRHTLGEMREAYLGFFEKRGHARLAPYPVVARWREDVLLTNASIYDFQPWVTSGQVPPPANPLALSQPCIRLDDLESVGRSGRHLSAFEMMAHHAFNTPQREVYWKDQTIQYCDELLRGLGARGEAITYKEKLWYGGGNAGPSVEVLLGGLEVATLVFMDLEVHPGGTVEVEGEKYRAMERRIVDTGYGLERFTWASQGTPTIYDAIFPDIVSRVRRMAGLGSEAKEHRDLLAHVARRAGALANLQGTKLASLRAEVAREVKMDPGELRKLLEPLESAYAITDHTRCLAWMLRDGVVPSNGKAGYLVRLVLRKTRRLLDSLGIRESLAEVVRWHLVPPSGWPPSPEGRRHTDIDNLETLLEMVRLEEQRYRETVERGMRLISRRLEEARQGGGIGPEVLVEFYDSHGLVPELAREAGEKMGLAVEVPEDFYSQVARRHSQAEAQAAGGAKLPDTTGLPSTRHLYHEDFHTLRFTARVQKVLGPWAVLDQTAFYPEGGGQDCDHGTLHAGDREMKVVDVQETQGVILHKLAETAGLSPGAIVEGRVDPERRMALARHHTATHLVLEAARRVLGPHAWQAGAHKQVDSARLDISHYQRITPPQLEQIEGLANEMAMSNLPVECAFVERNTAEKRHGFVLYQGGIPPGAEIRTVTVDGNVQACGGTHLPTTGILGPIVLLRSERIQDGVERLEYAAGEAALRHIRRRTRLLEEASGALRVQPEALPKTVERFFQEWKQLQKDKEQLQEAAALGLAAQWLQKAETLGSRRAVLREARDTPPDLAVKIAIELGRQGAHSLLLVPQGTEVRIVASAPPGGDARPLAKLAGEILGGSGGGKHNLAQGGGTRVEKIPEALEKARVHLRGLK